MWRLAVRNENKFDEKRQAIHPLGAGCGLLIECEDTVFVAALLLFSLLVGHKGFAIRMFVAFKCITKIKSYWYKKKNYC